MAFTRIIFLLQRKKASNNISFCSEVGWFIFRDGQLPRLFLWFLSMELVCWADDGSMEEARSFLRLSFMEYIIGLERIRNRKECLIFFFFYLMVFLYKWMNHKNLLNWLIKFRIRRNGLFTVLTAKSEK